MWSQTQDWGGWFWCSGAGLVVEAHHPNRKAQVADIGDHTKRWVLVLISAGAQTQLVLQWRNSGECMQLHQKGQN